MCISYFTTNAKEKKNQLTSTAKKKTYKKIHPINNSTIQFYFHRKIKERKYLLGNFIPKNKTQSTYFISKIKLQN